MTIWTQLASIAVFETEKLDVRPFAYSDGEDVYQIISNSDNLPFLFPCQKEKEVAIQFMVDRFMKAPLGNWGIVEKDTAQVIGALCLENINEQKQTAEMTYFLRKDKWGKGLMTEVVGRFVSLAVADDFLKSVTLIIHEENRASQAVARKAGFQQVAQYRGSDRYSHKIRNYLRFEMTASCYEKSKR